MFWLPEQFKIFCAAPSASLRATLPGSSQTLPAFFWRRRRRWYDHHWSCRSQPQQQVLPLLLCVSLLISPRTPSLLKASHFSITITPSFSSEWIAVVSVNAHVDTSTLTLSVGLISLPHRHKQNRFLSQANTHQPSRAAPLLTHLCVLRGGAQNSDFENNVFTQIQYMSPSPLHLSFCLCVCVCVSALPWAALNKQSAHTAERVLQAGCHWCPHRGLTCGLANSPCDEHVDDQKKKTEL